MKYFYTVALATMLGLSMAAQSQTQTTVQRPGSVSDNSKVTRQDRKASRKDTKQTKSPYWAPKDYMYMQENQGG